MTEFHPDDPCGAKYVESQTFTIPAIQDGPTGIGDLWDCHTSTTVGFNIFSASLTPTHLQAVTIQDFKSNLLHIKSSKDKHKVLNVKGEVLLELLGGLIKVSGWAEYDRDMETSTNEEEIIFTHDLLTYYVQAITAAKEVLDPLVVDKLLKGEIKATHLVRGMYLGGNMNASLRIRNTTSSSKHDIKGNSLGKSDKEDIQGNLLGKLTFGPVSGSANMSLGLLDTSKAKDFEKHIQVVSRPAIEHQPSTVKGLFKVVDDFGKLVKTQRYLSLSGLSDTEVYGVPIRFTLVPISQFLDIPIEKLYMQINDTTLDKLTELFVFLKDIQVYRFLSRRILEREPRMKMFLLDSNNPLSKQVAQNEKSMLELARKSYVKAADALKSYKANKIEQNGLLQMASKIGRQLNIGKILEDVDKYIQQGKKEMLSIHQGDMDEAHRIKILTNRIDLEEWYQPIKPTKILFRTSGPSVSGNVISSLYDISRPLTSMGIELGVALPNISNDQYSLSIKVDGSEEAYTGDMIRHVIDVLHLLVGKVSPLSMRFFTIFATLRGIKLPFHSHIKNLHKLIKILREVQHVSIAESNLQLRDCLQGSTHKFKFVLSLGAVESAAESVWAFLYLSSIRCDTSVADWIVGLFGFESCYEYSNAPLILVFKNEKFIASCIDMLDVLILHQALENSSNQDESGNVEWSLLDVSKANLEKNCFHRERGNFALKTLSMFESAPTFMESHQKLENLPGFPNAIDKEWDPQVTFTSLVIAGFCNLENEAILAGLGNIVVTAFPTLENNFSDSGWIKDNHSNILRVPATRTDFTALVTSLESFVQGQNPFSFKLSQAIGILDEFKNNPNSQKELITKYILGIRDDSDCPETLKIQLNIYLEMPHFEGTITKIMCELEKCLQSSCRPEYRQCLLLIKLLKLEKDEEDNEELRKFVEFILLPRLVVDLAVDENKYPNVAAHIQKCQQSQNIYSLLGHLASLKLSPFLFTLTKLLNSFVKIDDKNALHNLINGRLSKSLDDPQRHILFANQKIQRLLKRASQEQDFLEKVKFHHCLNDVVPNYIPVFLRTKLKELASEGWGDELPEELQNVDQVIGLFMRIANSGALPDSFSKVLRSSLENDQVLFHAFRDANALYYYDKSKHEFTEAWDCGTVRRAHNDLVAWMEVQNTAGNPQNHSIDLGLRSFWEADYVVGSAAESSFANSFMLIDHNIQDADSANFSKALEKSKLYRMMGPSHSRISQKEFIKVARIQETPSKRKTLENGYMAKLMPYIIQRLKMWGVHVLDPTNLSQFVDVSITPKTSTNHTSAPRGLFLRKKQPPATPKVTQKNEVASNTNFANIAQKNPISRLDFLTTLFTICNHLVFQDLVKVISQFPVALPFILPKIESESTQTYTCLLPLLKVVTVKWETEEGIVKQNQLFTDPYKLIVAMRIGTSEARTPGKSTILNLMLVSRYVFSSLADPGSELGKPLSLDGSVELVVLSKETCSKSFWKTSVKRHYSEDANQVLLLANVHGNAMDFPDTIRLLKKYASSFIVFFMPMSEDNLISNGSALEEEFSLDPAQTIPILVDPFVECKQLIDEDKIIYTSQLLTSDTTLQVVRNVLADAIKKEVPFPVQHQHELPTDSGRVMCFQEMATPESIALVRFIKELGVKNVKASLQLQKIDSKCREYGSKFFKIWKNSKILQNFITLFVKMLTLPIDDRLVSLAHLDREISALSAKESTAVRTKIAELQVKKRSCVCLEDSVLFKSQIQNMDDQINERFRELDAMTLGLENIYRELARVFEVAQSSPQSEDNRIIIEAARQCGETLIQGQAIEVLDGELMEICDGWFNAVCHTVCERFKDLKIFVLSIIGLQSSGKSTLLNALFACKFAVSVGRCTRGLFLRLLFIEDDLAAELGVDAILILDTEGLGAPEKLNDKNAEQKDRLLATYAMSLSNLALINVLGESLRDLTDILQIVVVTLARLEKAEISPDILMVQHLSERDNFKTMLGMNEFCEALKEAVTLTDEKDMDIGVQSCDSLRRLEQKLKKNELLHQFPPFKDGATVNAPPSKNYHDDVVKLYKVILGSIKERQIDQIETFHKWHERVQSYWNAVSTQNFALRFKNIKEVQDFIFRGVLIAKVKEAIDGAFRIHRDEFEAAIRQKVNELTSSNNEFNWTIEKGVLLDRMKNGLQKIPLNCPQTCDMCQNAIDGRKKLFYEVKNKDCEIAIHTTILKYAQTSRDDMMKHFSQMSEALIIQNGCIAEIDAIILKKLEEKIKIKSNCTELEVQQIVNEIWLQVTQTYSQKLTVPPAERQIQHEVDTVYGFVEGVARDVENQRQVNLRELEALDHGIWNGKFVRTDKKLTYRQVCLLEERLRQLPDQILKHYDTHHFETGMCAKLREVIDKTIEEFEKTYISEGKLIPEYKWKIHVKAIRHFQATMKQRDEVWNKVHNPLYILRAKEDKYRQEMEIRLRHGIGFKAEGKIVGSILLKAIRLLGQKFGDREHVAHIRQNGWLTGSENVRLKYFKSLAIKLKEGRKEYSLGHFMFPKASINEWFTQKVDSISKENGRSKFLETTTSEYSRVTQQIRNSASYSEIAKYVQNYLTNVEGMEYNPNTDLMTSTSKTDFQVFSTALLRKLEGGKDSSLRRNIEITNPSKHVEVKKLLGCTEDCPLCGALCWGEYGHENHDDNTNKHHTCHQPRGLGGMSVVQDENGSNYLQPLSCDNIDETTWEFINILDENGTYMDWRDVKLHKDYCHWLYTPHNRNEFHELMKWFFVELQQVLASHWDYNVTPSVLLEELGFRRVQSLDSILSTINSRIGSK